MSNWKYLCENKLNPCKLKNNQVGEWPEWMNE